MNNHNYIDAYIAQIDRMLQLRRRRYSKKLASIKAKYEELQNELIHKEVVAAFETMLQKLNNKCMETVHFVEQVEQLKGDCKNAPYFTDLLKMELTNLSRLEQKVFLHLVIDKVLYQPDPSHKGVSMKIKLAPFLNMQNK